MTKSMVAHDTVPDFMERFAIAYTAQLRNFAQNVVLGRPAPVSIDDGIEAMRIALAARQSLLSGLPVEVASVVA
jgi:predicted dehydrogenase